FANDEPGHTERQQNADRVKNDGDARFGRQQFPPESLATSLNQVADEQNARDEECQDDADQRLLAEVLVPEQQRYAERRPDPAEAERDRQRQDAQQGDAGAEP